MDVTGATKVVALQRILASGKDLASMVGLSGADCSPQLVRTFVGGDDYEVYQSDLAGTWFANPATPTSLHSASGDVPAPCTIISLAPTDAKSAAVLCADETVRVSADAGATWALLSPITGAITLTAAGGGYLVAVAGNEGCAGVQLVSLTTKLAASQAGCYAMAVPAESLPGNVALSSADSTLWLWAGDSVVRSADAGATWQ